MKYLRLYLFLFFLTICMLEYSSSCLGGKEFNEEEFTTFTKKIEYRFEDRRLLSNALTHSSVLRQKTDVDEFQRLEHLGDKVLNLVITDYLYEIHPKKNEGYLTEESKKLISNDYVLKVAKQLNLLNDVIYEIDKSSLDKGLDKVSYTACEALIGAIYKDGGLDCANKFIHTHFILGGQEILNEKKEIIQINHIENNKNTINNNKVEVIPLKQQPVNSISANSELPFKTLKEFRKLCEYTLLTPLQYYEATVKIGEKTFIGQDSSKKGAKRLAAKEAYETLTNTKIGKKKVFQALETKFPKKVHYSPIICNNNNEAEIEASYSGHTETGKGESVKKAKTEALKKLFEHFKS